MGFCVFKNIFVFLLAQPQPQGLYLEQSVRLFYIVVGVVIARCFRTVSRL